MKGVAVHGWRGRISTVLVAGGMLATGTGARVQMNHPDGSQWLFCAGGSECPMPLGCS
jgi:hypothetical protein